VAEAKHTPGPWSVVAPRNKLDGFRCAIVSPQGAVAWVVDTRSEADAQLIAAAPDLLTALVRLVEETPFQSDTESCECGENGNGRDDKGNVCEHIRARRAIAKARGEQS
jgi:hypothetical protein